MNAAEPFVSGEEKRAILLDRSADSPAKLVEDERLFDRIKIIPGIQYFVAIEFVKVTVNLIGTRLGHDIHNRARIAAILSVKAVGEDAKFLDAVGAGLDGGQVREQVISVATVDTEVVS